MKDYLKQFYNEGLATTFYMKPVNFLKKRIENKKVVKFLSMLIKILYTMLVLLLAGYILYRKLS